MRYLIQFLVKYLINRAIKQNKVFYISDRKITNSSTYMVRYVIFKCKWFGIYIHKFLKNDYAELHNHPWNFYSYILNLGYYEDILLLKKNKLIIEQRFNKPGSFLIRKSTHTHRVQLDKELTLDQLNEAVTTIVFIGKKTSEWGFFIEKEKGVYDFIHWRQYLGIKEGDPSKEIAVLKDMDMDL